MKGRNDPLDPRLWRDTLFYDLSDKEKLMVHNAGRAVADSFRDPGTRSVGPVGLTKVLADPLTLK